MRRLATTSIRFSSRPGYTADADEIKTRLDLRACRFEPFPFDALLPRIESDRIVLPADEPGTRPYGLWQPIDGIELPVRYGPLTLGRFVLVLRTPTCGVAIPAPLRTAAIAIAQRTGDALGSQWTAYERRTGADREEDTRV
jgi:hypothetical protein